MKIYSYNSSVMHRISKEAWFLTTLKKNHTLIILLKHILNNPMHVKLLNYFDYKHTYYEAASGNTRVLEVTKHTFATWNTEENLRCNWWKMSFLTRLFRHPDKNNVCGQFQTCCPWCWATFAWSVISSLPSLSPHPTEKVKARDYFQT